MNRKKGIVTFGMVFIFCVSLGANFHIIERLEINSGEINHNIQPYSASVDNRAIIDDVLDFKLADYAANGYFSDLYKTSIHAIYYAVHALETLGRLSLIDEGLITSFIMAHFNSSSGIFEDDYSNRYLSIDFSRPYRYYPCSSLLELNCYAVLALDLLGSLDLIDAQDFMDFIWSCYNPVTSGFIGQPYDSGLVSQYKISTMDNTFYAVQALNVLNIDWVGYSDEKNDIIDFINGLQNPNGAFKNDADPIFQSFFPQEISMLSAYYSVKTLKLFDMVSSINIPNFYQYLDDNYISPGEHSGIVEDDFFVFYSTGDVINQSNLIATAIGLEMSQITGFTGYNEQEAIQYLLDHRNALGNWDDGVEYGYHEIVYTFQIMRSLDEINAQISTPEKDEIANAIMKYYDGYSGFCLISPDYTSVELINSLINSFDAMNRLGDLDTISTDIYNSEMDVLTYNQGYPYFLYATRMHESNARFLTCPIELYNTGTKQKVKIIDTLTSIKNNYYVLEAMEKTFKLDDLDAVCDLQLFVDEIVACQLLDSEYDAFGGFLPYHNYIFLDQVFLEYSYYAIKTLELLTDFMGTGSELDVNFDRDALFTYIFRNIIETPDILYFDPQYARDTDIVLQNTYYMAYILKTIDLYALNDEKMEAFISQNVNYSSVKNIYYCYKISDLLNLDFDFDVATTQALIHDLHDPGLSEFYLTIQKNTICQEVIWWICDVAENDRIRITPSLSPSVVPGGWNNISCTLGNLVLDDFGTYATVRFESPQLGVEFLSKSGNLFYKNVQVPNEASGHSIIEGNLSVYFVADRVAWKYISFLITNNDDPSDLTPLNLDSAIGSAIPLIISFLAIPGCVIVISSKQKRKSKNRLNRS